MPRRWGKLAHLFAYRYLVERDGEQCARCFNTPTALKEKDPTALNTLDIDHIDGNIYNREPDNLRLLCRRCNVTLGNQARSNPSARNERENEDKNERERKSGNVSTRILHQTVDYKAGSPEMQVTLFAEDDFREWTIARVNEGRTLKSDITNGGAETFGVSPLTTTRWLSKLTSFTGPLYEVRDMLKDIHLVLKDHLKPEPTILVDLDHQLAQSGQRESAHPEEAQRGEVLSPNARQTKPSTPTSSRPVPLFPEAPVRPEGFPRHHRHS